MVLTSVTPRDQQRTTSTRTTQTGFRRQCDAAEAVCWTSRASLLPDTASLDLRCLAHLLTSAGIRMAAAQDPAAADSLVTAAAPAVGPPAASSSSSIQADTTVLATLHNLLRAHVAAHPSPTLPYLHPYAPLPESAWKGKARAGLLSQSQQADALKVIRETMEGAKSVLAKRENERLRLTRAMKEV